MGEVLNRQQDETFAALHSKGRVHALPVLQVGYKTSPPQKKG
jgi:hypothetical protein